MQVAARKALTEQYDDDLDQWRSAILAKRVLSREYTEGFQMMDMDNGALWDLTKQLMAYEPSKRLSAASALTHEAFGKGLFGKINVVLARAQGVVDQVIAGSHQRSSSKLMILQRRNPIAIAFSSLCLYINFTPPELIHCICLA